MALRPEEIVGKSIDLRVRILVPVLLVLAFLVFLEITAQQRELDMQLERHVSSRLDTLSAGIKHEVESHAHAMEMVLDTLEQDPALNSALQHRDRSALQLASSELFLSLRRHMGISHMSFSGPDQVSILRVHKPGYFGDTIEGAAMLEAVKTGLPVSGVGSRGMGSDTLRVVDPWHHEGRLIGYVELGLDVGRLFDHVADQLNINAVLIKKKTGLDRVLWEEGQVMLGNQPDWAAFPDSVVTGLAGQLAEPDFMPDFGLIRNADIGKGPVQDINGTLILWQSLDPHVLGGQTDTEIYVAFDVSSWLMHHDVLILRTVVVSLVAACLLAILLYVLSGRAQRIVDESREVLVSFNAELEKHLYEQTTDLRRSEIELAEAQHLVQMGSWTLDRKTGDLKWSTEMFQIFEISRDKFELSYINFLDAVHPDDRERVTRTYSDSVRNKTSHNIIYRLLMGDGRIKFVQDQGKTFYAEGGVPIRSIGTAHDITRLKQAEAAASEKEERLRSILATVPHGIEDIDCAGIIQYANHGLHRLYGYSDGELIGKSICDMDAGGESLLEYLNCLTRDQPKPVPYQRKKLTRAGEYIDVEVHWNYKRDAEGNPVGFTSIISDITERKQGESERQHLLELNRFLLNLSSKIQEEERRDIAHELHDELGQMLAGIRMDVDFIRGTFNDSTSEESAAAEDIQMLVEQATDRIRVITEHLRPMMLDQLGLEAAVREMVDKWATRNRDVDCCFSLKGTLDGLAEVMNLTLYRLIQECLTNITRHAAAHHVEIRIERQPGHIALSIEDDGCGMDTAHTDSGFGQLGMRERLQATGGSFEIKSQPGDGVKVIASLPLSDVSQHRNQFAFGKRSLKLKARPKQTVVLPSARPLSETPRQEQHKS